MIFLYTFFFITGSCVFFWTLHQTICSKLSPTNSGDYVELLLLSEAIVVSLVGFSIGSLIILDRLFASPDAEFEGRFPLMIGTVYALKFLMEKKATKQDFTTAEMQVYGIVSLGVICLHIYPTTDIWHDLLVSFAYVYFFRAVNVLALFQGEKWYVGRELGENIYSWMLMIPVFQFIYQNGYAEPWVFVYTWIASGFVAPQLGSTTYKMKKVPLDLLFTSMLETPVALE